MSHEGSQDLIFSLDIGTRKVIGLVARKEQDRVRVVDAELIEHTSRTMLDGQIHNINGVAKVVKEIKQRLEQRLQTSLRQVSVAVAGRSLKTVNARIEKTLSLYEEITADQVRNLELEAVSSILHDAGEHIGPGDYYCVGYSVIYYALDGARIGDLTGHFGKSMAVEVIATFLPRVVLDSMISVLNRAELEATNLTLEPIAAMNVIIPQDVRHLNLALVDIGAGTSDIALTRDGAVCAYGMVPEAGDEITEALCEKFILDFKTAETIKRQLMIQDTVTFRDILGKDHVVETHRIVNLIRPRIAALAASVSLAIKALNQSVPHAIILVGGGSLTPLFVHELAAALPLDASNIGIRMPQMIEGIVDGTGMLTGPDMVTPLGICYMSALSTGLKFVEMTVNHRPIHVLDMKQNLDVLSALVAAGVEKMRLYGHIGKALCVEVNGELKVIKGKMGAPAKVLVNDQPAEITTKVHPHDRITFIEAENGEDARGTIKDFIDVRPVTVTLNGNEVTAMPAVRIDGVAEVDINAEVYDRQAITVSPICVRDVLECAGIATAGFRERDIVVRINKNPKVLSQSMVSLTLNGSPALLDTLVHDASVLEFFADRPAFFRIKDVVSMPPRGKDIEVVLNGKKQIIAGAPGAVFMNGKRVDPEEFLIDGAEIVTYAGDTVPPTVSQLLEYLDVDFAQQKGKHLEIIVDGGNAGFTTPVSDGAMVSINFVER